MLSLISTKQSYLAQFSLFNVETIIFASLWSKYVSVNKKAVPCCPVFFVTLLLRYLTHRSDT